MSQLSQNFSLEEATFSQTAVRHGIVNQPDEQTLERMRQAAISMERVRSFLGHGIRVSSWLRVIQLNRAIGSKDSSDHVYGCAIDFTCQAFGTPYEICKAIIDSGIEFSQMIYEGAWVHISFRHDRIHRREVLTAKFQKNGKAVYKKGLVA